MFARRDSLAHDLCLQEWSSHMPSLCLRIWLFQLAPWWTSLGRFAEM